MAYWFNKTKYFPKNKKMNSVQYSEGLCSDMYDEYNSCLFYFILDTLDTSLKNGVFYYA